MAGPPLSTQVSPRPAWVLVPRGASPTSFSPLRSSAQTLPCPQLPLPRLASKRGGWGGTGRQTGPCRGKCRPWRGPARCHGRGTAWGCGQGAAVSPGDCPPSGAKAHTQGCGARPVGRRTGAEGGWHGGRGTREKGGTWDTQGPVRAAVVTRRRSRGRVRVRGRLPVSHGAPARRPLGPPHKAPPPRTPPHHGPAATRRYGRRGGGRGTHQPGPPPPPPIPGGGTRPMPGGGTGHRDRSGVWGMLGGNRSGARGEHPGVPGAEPRLCPQGCRDPLPGCSCPCSAAPWPPAARVSGGCYGGWGGGQG